MTDSMKAAANSSGSSEIATFGGGCFWCLEAVFESLKGVESVTSGYAGGTVDSPTYEQVCTGRSGHAEVIQIAFSPHIISYEILLDLFFAFHDPTTLNRQGADVGTKYRSVVFFHNDDQRVTAIKKVESLEKAMVWPDPIVTEIAPCPTFFPAEKYHQGYFKQHDRQPYCQLVISPKVAKLKSKHADLLKKN